MTVVNLGAGTDDTGVVAYAEREDRLLVTYDDDFLADYDALDRIGVLFQPDDRRPPFETATIVDTIEDHVNQETIREHDEPFHLTTDWL